jgi:Calcium-dependent channel, 7TM region, putative phosphate
LRNSPGLLPPPTAPALARHSAPRGTAAGVRCGRPPPPAAMHAVSLSDAASAVAPPGHAHKAVFEATSTSSALYFVVLINVLIAWIGLLLYRYVILRQAGLLSPDELALLRKYPPVRAAQSYTPEDTFVRGAPPMRWTGWRDFFAASDAHLSRDAQVYLLFQRACMATTAVCGLVSSVVLLPSYWLGGALTSEAPAKPMSLANLLRSDRGVFERFTSRNLPPDSPLVVLQIPVVAVAASCIVVLHTLVRAATHDSRTLDEWLCAPPRPPTPSASSNLFGERQDGAGARRPRQLLGRPPERSPPTRARLAPSPAGGNANDNRGSTAAPSTPPSATHNPLSSFLGSSPRSPAPPNVAQSAGGGGVKYGWTLFARGLPADVRSKAELLALLDAIYPGQVRSVELVCKGRMSEARLLRARATARNRLNYLYDTPDLDLQLADPGGGDVAATARTAVGAEPAPSSSFVLWSRVLRRACGKRRNRQALISDLVAEVAALERELTSHKHEPVRDFLGCAFITVRSPEAASSLVHDFPLGFRVSRRRGDDGMLLPQCATSPVSSERLPGDSAGGGPLAFLQLHTLHRATVMLLPPVLRRMVAPSRLAAPASLGCGTAGDGRLPAGQASSVRIVTRESATARLRAMKAERAPKSGDIVWSNIGISFFERTCREVLVQMFVFACLILFTSPVAMLTAMRLIVAEVALLSDTRSLGQSATAAATSAVPTVTAGLTNVTAAAARLAMPDIATDDNAADDISAELMSMLPVTLTSNTLLRSVLLAYIPVLLLAVVFALVPSLLRVISGLEGYPTRTDREMSVFRKTSFYYLMNAVLLPSLALNTASEFLEMVYKQSDGGANVYNALPILQSLFSGDIAFFLCNYLVQLAFSGSVFWLMRLPASMSMMVRRRLALTPLEAAEAKCTCIFDFPRHFSYSVAVMSMCLLFGFMAPLIWWFAFLYYICKHAVDTYLIRYVHPRSHIDGRLPRLATTFVLAWTCVAQLALAAIFYLQGRVRAGVVTAALCALTLAACASVGPRLGSRLLGIIPDVRDMLIRRVFMDPRDEHSWFFGHNTALATSPSMSSSTSSLAESTEEDPLLRGRKGWPAGNPASPLHGRSPELGATFDRKLELSDDETDGDDESGPLCPPGEGHTDAGSRGVYGTVA